LVNDSKGKSGKGNNKSGIDKSKKKNKQIASTISALAGKWVDSSGDTHHCSLFRPTAGSAFAFSGVTAKDHILCHWDDYRFSEKCPPGVLLSALTGQVCSFDKKGLDAGKLSHPIMFDPRTAVILYYFCHDDIGVSYCHFCDDAIMICAAAVMIMTRCIPNSQIR
jgi:hypothetical protein